MRRTLFALPALAAVLAAPLAAAEPVVLKPGSSWNVDFAADKCQLIRVFGTGDDQHFLRFQQYAPGEWAGLTVAGPAFKRFQSLVRTDIRFYEGQTPHKTKPLTGQVDTFGPGVIYSAITIDRGAPERSADDKPDSPTVLLLDPALGKQVQFIELRQSGRTVRLETGPLDAAFEVLNQCTLDLLRDWGLDPEKHLTAKSAPRWINKDLIVRRIMSDYPEDALMQGEQGVMRMRVIVSAEGTVESCTILKATKTNELESPACRMMKAARFEPALDSTGAAFRSFYSTAITYQIG